MEPAVSGLSEVLLCVAFGVVFAIVLEALAHFLAAESANAEDAPGKDSP